MISTIWTQFYGDALPEIMYFTRINIENGEYEYFKETRDQNSIDGIR